MQRMQSKADESASEPSANPLTIKANNQRWSGGGEFNNVRNIFNSINVNNEREVRSAFRECRRSLTRSRENPSTKDDCLDSRSINSCSHYLPTGLR